MSRPARRFRVWVGPKPSEFFAWCIVPWALAAACAPEDIRVATRHVDVATTVGAVSGSGGAAVSSASATGGNGGTGGAGGGAPSGCFDNDDCGLDEYCAKSQCSSPQGTCEPRPTSCDASYQPVCGCNGTTYYNDCLRRQYGAIPKMIGECGTFTATKCGGPSQKACVGDAFCSLVLVPPGFCPPQPYGKCWILPSVCPEPPPPGDRYKPCQGMGPCLDVCSAIRAELPYTKAKDCGKP